MGSGDGESRKHGGGTGRKGKEKEKSLLNEREQTTWMNLNNEEEVSLNETIMVHGSIQIAGLR